MKVDEQNILWLFENPQGEDELAKFCTFHLTKIDIYILGNILNKKINLSH